MQDVLELQLISPFPKYIIWNSRLVFNLRSRDANAGRLKVNQDSNRRIQIMNWITAISNLAVERKAYLPGILEVAGLNLHPIFLPPHVPPSTCHNIYQKCKIIPVHAIKSHRGSRGIAPFILNRGIRWRLVFNIQSQPLYSTGGKKNMCPLNRTLGGRHSRYRRLGKRKFSCPCQNSNPGPSSPQPRRYTDYNRKLWSDTVQTWQAFARVLGHGWSSFPYKYHELYRKGTQWAHMS